MDESLISRAQTGDHKAFVEILRHYDRPVMSIIYRFTANLYDREDLYQEIFLHCFRSIASFRFQSSFKTWLTRLALNCCIDYMKKVPPLAQAQDRFQGLSQEQFQDHSQHEASITEIDWEQQQKLSAVHNALKQLAGPQRICFHMYYIEDWSIKEISALLQCNEGTIKTHMSRARKRIKSNTRVMQWQLNPI